MKHTKEELEEKIKQCNCKADFCRSLDLNPIGGNYKTIDKLISKYNLDTSHFITQPWNKGKNYINKQYSLDEILIKDSPHRNTSSLRIRLINAGLKKNECELCGYSESVELHHINGDPYDNRLENLQILCPNCHAKTDNYCSKNINKGRIIRDPKTLVLTEEEIEQRELEKKAKKCGKTLEEYLEAKLKGRRRLEDKTCPICGKLFRPNDSLQKYCSVECYRQDSKGNRPPVFELIQSFKECGNFVKIAEKYGVTDNAVRKWCKFYDIPFHTKELKEYITGIEHGNYIPKPCEKQEKKVLDRDKIIQDYLSGIGTTEISRLHNCDPSSVRKILKENNIEKRRIGQAIYQYDISKNLVQQFEVAKDAVDWIINNNLTSVKEDSIRTGIARSNKSDKPYYGYIWKYNKLD